MTMVKKKCSAPWCLMAAMDGAEACQLHVQLPVIKTRGDEGKFVYVESADQWKTRYRRMVRAAKEAAKKQVESDAKMARR